MALCELIEQNLSDDIIIKKFGHEDFKVGSRLVVKPYQSAVFVRDGKIHKTFGPGAYTLNSNIFPFITKLYSRVIFGTRNAFNCQVYFINTSQLDKIKYGVPGIHCSDAKYHVPITLGAHGSYMLAAQDPELIMSRLCGGKDELRTERFREKYCDQLEMLVPEYLKKILYGAQMSALDADACHSDIAFAIKTKLNDEFSKTGVLIDTFSIISSVNENDLSRIKDIEWNYLEKLKAVDIEAYRRERQGYTYQDEQLYKLMGEYVNSPNAMSVSEQMLAYNSELRNASGASPFGLVLYGILNDMVKRIVPDNYSRFAGQSAAYGTPRGAESGSGGRDHSGKNTVCPACGELCAPDASYCSVCGKKLK